jgi:hypothetical protein
MEYCTMLGETPVLVVRFSFEIQNLSATTLSCFGAYYQEDVLDPLADESPFTFMKRLGQVAFYGEALELKKII